MEMGREEAQATLWLRHWLWVLCLAGTDSWVWANSTIATLPQSSAQRDSQGPWAARCCRTP